MLNHLILIVGTCVRVNRIIIFILLLAVHSFTKSFFVSVVVVVVVATKVFATIHSISFVFIRFIKLTICGLTVIRMWQIVRREDKKKEKKSDRRFVFSSNNLFEWCMKWQVEEVAATAYLSKSVKWILEFVFIFHKLLAVVDFYHILLWKRHFWRNIRCGCRKYARFTQNLITIWKNSIKWRFLENNFLIGNYIFEYSSKHDSWLDSWLDKMIHFWWYSYKSQNHNDSPRINDDCGMPASSFSSPISVWCDSRISNGPALLMNSHIRSFIHHQNERKEILYRLDANCENT